MPSFGNATLTMDLYRQPSAALRACEARKVATSRHDSQPLPWIGPGRTRESDVYALQLLMRLSKIATFRVYWIGVGTRECEVKLATLPTFRRLEQQPLLTWIGVVERAKQQTQNCKFSA